MFHIKTLDSQINSRPVIYFTFKNCKVNSSEELTVQLKQALLEEYSRYWEIFAGKLDDSRFSAVRFKEMYENLMRQDISYIYLSSTLTDLIRVVAEYYGVAPILLIDEYDQPIMSSYEAGIHGEMGSFFSNFYGAAMKGNEFLGQALLTGVQRVAKESIFSQFNNARVYTVLNPAYASCFGVTEQEAQALLTAYGYSLDETVKRKYDGYQFGGIEVYNPWSLLNYAATGALDNYWVNTSSNTLVRHALKHADRRFWQDFDRLVLGEKIEVWLTLETSYVERDSNYSLWGLLVNSGYLTVRQRVDVHTAVVQIPNEEVMAEFQMLISEIAGIEGLDLQQMLEALVKKDMKRFFDLYQNIVVSCTSFMDAKENAYHMLFLGMCIALRGLYKVTSNLEAGDGRSDITLEAIKPGYPNIIVEFKQGKNTEKLKGEALQQILDKRYYAGLKGETICVGLSHDRKRCEMAYQIVQKEGR